MQSMIISFKNIVRLTVLAIAVLFYFFLITPTHAQVGIPAGGVELDGYAWSSNIGWISMNCKTGGITGNDICATSNYKATVQTDGTVTGYAWSSNIGWVRFGGLSNFPSSPGTMAVNARMTGTYPDLTFEGWVRACSGDDMDSACNPTSVATSTSLTWTPTSPSQDFFVEVMGAGNANSIAFGSGRFIAIADGNDGLLTSTDGVTWTAINPLGNDYRAVTYGNGLFVVVNHTNPNRVITSPDGITWTARTTPLAAWKSVSYGNGLFVAVACGMGTTCNATAGNRVMTSTDGITWTARSAPIATWNAVTYGNGLFIAVSETFAAGNIMTSPDGITWTARSVPNGFWGDVKYGNGTYIITAWSGSGTLLTSPDGITWTTRSVPSVPSTQSLVFFNSLFYASYWSTIFSSPDGITWTRATYFDPPVAGNWFALGVGNSRIVVGPTALGPTSYMGSTSTSSGTGWDGWISLRSTAAPTHSIVMSSTGASATSYAWGSAVMGWINFDDVRFLTPTATLSGTNCSIPAGASTCNSSFSWNIQNATSPNLRNSTRSVTYTTTAAGTTTPYAITQGANTVQARDNNTVLASVVVTGTCAAGTDFANGTTCELSVVPAPVITITTNKTIARTGDTVLVSWTMNPSPIASGTCSVSGPGMPSSVTTTGSQTSNALASKTRFTLTCTGAYGTVRANADVEIIPKASEV